VANGNEIIVSVPHRGVFIEGIISGTDKPGTVMQIKAATEPVGNRFTWEKYDRSWDAQTGLIAILLEDKLQGKLATDAYVTGTRCFLYCPAMGETLNVLLKDITGTASDQDYAIGDYLEVDDGTGKLQDASTGTTRNYSAPFVLLETITDLAADQLVWAMYTGH
jgi:hypothetical protein